MSIFERVQHLSFLQTFLISLALGSISALAMAPTYLSFVLFLTIPLWIALFKNIPSAKQAFAIGWGWGFGFFTLSLYWIGFALTVPPADFIWALPLAMIGLPLFLSIYPGLAVLLTHYLTKNNQTWLPLCFAIAFSIMEYLRGIVFTGFPWNLIGNSWGWSTDVLQVTSVIGIYGLGFITIFACSLMNKWRGFSIGLFILSSLWLYGQKTIPETPMQNHTNIQAILVQPNILQEDKWRPEFADQHLQTLLNLSTQNLSSDKQSIIIWPETALTYLLENHPDRTEKLDQLFDKNSWLLTGGVGIKRIPNERPKIYNSLLYKQGNQTDWARYDKAHLVPFGEYIPFQKYMNFLPFGGTSFTAGKGLETIQLNKNLPTFSPLICYEAIFPNKVRSNQNSSPDILLNITNDAWYGNSIGPYQHHDLVKVRAIEEGIPLIRVANTGISSVIDPYGRVLTKTRLGTQASMQSAIPLKKETPTLYSRYGNTIYGLIILLLSLIYLTFRHFTLFKEA